MKLPWQTLTGLSKMAAIFATILVIAIGFCGLNLIVTSRGHDYPSPLVMLTGILESLAIIGSALGLIIIGLIAIIHSIFPATPNSKDDQ